MLRMEHSLHERKCFNYNSFYYTVTLAIKRLRPILVLVDRFQIKQLVTEALNDELLVFCEATGKFYI